MHRTFFFGMLFLLSISICEAQEKDEYDEKYDWRIRQEVLYGTYIPRDVSDAIIRLNQLTDEESKKKYMSIPEEQVTHALFFSLGRWITHNWGLFEGSRLSVSMQAMGIHHPDDMARFIMVVFHRSLLKEPLEIKELVELFEEKNQKEKEERLKSGTIIHEETRKVDKPAGGN